MKDDTAGERPLPDAFRVGTSGEIPEIYANGFSIGLSNADVVLVLVRSARPIQTVHMSYTLAKTLHLKLATLVNEFEEAVGREMLTTDDVDKMRRLRGTKEE
jgi:hypothetical protein